MARRFVQSVTVGFVAFGATLLVGSSVAQAHVTLVSPMNRYEELAYDNAYQKSSPCGHADNPAGNLAPVVYQAGETITITIDEYVSHSGFIRVAVAGSDQAFSAPTSVDAIEDANTILLVPDMNPGGEFDLDVTLPDTPCDPCVLQMIQVMTTSGGDFNGNYYQCADIVIEGAAATTGDTTGDGSTGDATTGDSGGTSSGTTTTTGSGGSASASTTGSDASTGGDGGTGGDTDGTGDALPASSSGDEGCSVGTQRSRAPGWLLLGVLGLLGLRSRRRTRLPQ